MKNSLVADTILLVRAVSAQMSNVSTLKYCQHGFRSSVSANDNRTVVALLATSAVTRHMSISSTSVACLLATTETLTTASAVATSKAALLAAGSCLGTIACYMSDFTALVAFSRAGSLVLATLGLAFTGLFTGAFSGEMTGLTAAEAGLFLRWTGAITA
jgi:hypothetical protein